MPNIITGKVIQKLDDYKIVINKGRADGVTSDNRFLIYRLGEELFDPDTKESLGVLELVCGEGKPEHIQEKITTLYTAKYIITKTKTVKKSSPYGGLFSGRVVSSNLPLCLITAATTFIRTAIAVP